MVSLELMVNSENVMLGEREIDGEGHPHDSSWGAVEVIEQDTTNTRPGRTAWLIPGGRG